MEKVKKVKHDLEIAKELNQCMRVSEAKSDKEFEEKV
jgi:hypothetical protein